MMRYGQMEILVKGLRTTNFGDRMKSMFKLATTAILARDSEELQRKRWSHSN